ncbi:Calpain catalytic domain-containing protein [Entamoeba marina]
MLLEKAYAMFIWCNEKPLEYVSTPRDLHELTEIYQCINGGSPTVALQHLTGKKAEELFLNEYRHDPNFFWDILNVHDSKNCIMVAVCPSNGNFQKQYGLIGHHAYSLISTYVARTFNEDYYLLKLRNPWGGGEWKGRWSDKSKLWALVGGKPNSENYENDGIFYMDINEFVKYFSMVSVV